MDSQLRGRWPGYRRFSRKSQWHRILGGRVQYGSEDTQRGEFARIARFSCSSCEQTFGRVEHLTRHEKSHTKEGWLRCEAKGCRKSFYRTDALRRHELVHKKAKRSLLGRGARACFACAMTRRRCSGGNPCEVRSMREKIN
ncbi:hypothetical protein EAF00_005670 [Botryotinia globosa]|nr:hypothetical protein EAF00_005670 [Botryotinia globosa]